MPGMQAVLACALLQPLVLFVVHLSAVRDGPARGASRAVHRGRRLGIVCAFVDVATGIASRGAVGSIGVGGATMARGGHDDGGSPGRVQG